MLGSARPRTRLSRENLVRNPLARGSSFASEPNLIQVDDDAIVLRSLRERVAALVCVSLNLARYLRPVDPIAHQVCASLDVSELRKLDFLSARRISTDLLGYLLLVEPV